MKVLFVDDEERVLDGIVRSLFHLEDEWSIAVATSGAQALDQLAKEPFDVIVSDMRMPAMDGAELLKRVCERYPQMIRVVLSGHSDTDASMRVANLAHQFLTKPCDADTLQGVVERALSLKKLLRSEELHAIVASVKRLPSPPKVYNALSAALSDARSGINDVADIVQRDPAISAKILQLVNSAFFANATAVSDMRQAVGRLGVQMIKNLALAVEAFPVRRGASPQEASLIERVQQHGLIVGKLARQMFAERHAADEAFMAGLLVDIGTLVAMAEMPSKLREMVAHADCNGLRHYQAEEALWNVTHAEIGAHLLSLWGLPPRIVEAVAFHHHPERVAVRGLDLLAATYIANELAEGRVPSAEYVKRVGCDEAKLRDLQAQAEQLRQETRR